MPGVNGKYWRKHTVCHGSSSRLLLSELIGPASALSQYHFFSCNVSHHHSHPQPSPNTILVQRDLTLPLGFNILSPFFPSSTSTQAVFSTLSRRQQDLFLSSPQRALQTSAALRWLQSRALPQTRASASSPALCPPVQPGPSSSWLGLPSAGKSSIPFPSVRFRPCQLSILPQDTHNSVLVLGVCHLSIYISHRKHDCQESSQVRTPSAQFDTHLTAISSSTSVVILSASTSSPPSICAA